MLLRQWKKKNKLNNRQMANMFNFHESMFSHYFAGRKNFTAESARTITKKTKGEVTEMEILYRK